MPNIFLKLEYNGAGFHGYQIQPGLRTIESELRLALQMVLREPVHKLYAAGRTDAGVHALGQVVNFWSAQLPDFDKLTSGVSHILRGELSVVECKVVADDFHARKNAKRKQYSYTILNRPGPPVLNRGRVLHRTGRFEIERMQAEALKLVGRHDFLSFRDADCNSKTSVREIYESELISKPPYLIYRVVGNGFLKQMVRIIVGTLLAIGRNRLEPNDIRQILELKDRNKAGPTAPAHGLCLDWVEY